MCRTKEAEHVRMLEDHKRMGAEHEKRGASLTEEARLLRAKADEHHRGLEPHAQCVATPETPLKMCLFC